MSKEKEAIELCPFCGNEAMGIYTQSDGSFTHVCCSNHLCECGSIMSIKDWNKRVKPERSEPVGEVAELKAKLGQSQGRHDASCHDLLGKIDKLEKQKAQQGEIERLRGLIDWIKTELQCSGEASYKIIRIAQALKNSQALRPAGQKESEDGIS